MAPRPAQQEAALASPPRARGPALGPGRAGRAPQRGPTPRRICSREMLRAVDTRTPQPWAASTGVSSDRRSNGATRPRASSCTSQGALSSANTHTGAISRPRLIGGDTSAAPTTRPGRATVLTCHFALRPPPPPRKSPRTLGRAKSPSQRLLHIRAPARQEMPQHKSHEREISRKLSWAHSLHSRFGRVVRDRSGLRVSPPDDRGVI
jgi:hypothetical protein